jgi:hypothetical protein
MPADCAVFGLKRFFIFIVDSFTEFIEYDFNMKVTNDSFTCPRCEGTGAVSLSGDLLETLNAVRDMGKASADAVWRKLDPKQIFHVTAFNNRLSELARLGFLDRKRESRLWIYSPVKQTKTRK